MNAIEPFDNSQSQSQSQAKAGPTPQVMGSSIQIQQIDTQNQTRPCQIQNQAQAQAGGRGRGRPRNKALTKKTLFTPSQQPIQTGYEKRFYRPDIDKLEEDQKYEVGVLKWEEDGRIVTQGIQLDHQVKMGGGKSCKIRVYGNKVSETHLIFYSVRTSSPLALVCMQDVSSTTGYILNGKPYHRDKRVKIGSQKVGFGVVVLRDGDTIQIPGTTEVLKYHHNWGPFHISPQFNNTIGDYNLFSTSNGNHYIDTNVYRIHNHPLGEGTFGVVNLATHKTVGLQVAIKTVDSRMSQTEDWRVRLEEEVGVMKRLNHPNILRVLDQMKDQGRGVELNSGAARRGDGNGDEDEQGWDWGAEGVWKAHMVFELAAGGDLFSYCEANGRVLGLTEEETKFLAWQLVLGIEHIHSQGVVHRDLKLENIMLQTRDSFPRLLIGDFGASTTLEAITALVPKSSSGPMTRSYERAGTVNYLPPERLKAFGREVKLHGLGESIHGKARIEAMGKRWFDDEVQLDIWALGVVVYQMICGLHPYQDISPFQLASQGSQPMIKPEPTIAGVNVSKEPLFLPCPSYNPDIPDAGPSQTNPNLHPKPHARKFADLDDESSQGSEAIIKKTLCTGGDWDTFRDRCGQGTRGDTHRAEDREVERLLVDLGYFKDQKPYEWKPRERWREISNDCIFLLVWILQYRRERRASIAQIKTHPWFTSQQSELNELYKTIVMSSSVN